MDRQELVKNFQQTYNMLNTEQKKAVDNIEGPVLVIAGPGTGKTQLLSARIANILAKTDISAENILAMTFTEAGARNMRERLKSFIGKEAYKIGIFTYHAFANDLISQCPEYFLERNLENLADDLTLYEILSSIKQELPYNSLIKYTEPMALLSVINDFKRANLSTEDIKIIAKQNIALDDILLEKIQSASDNGELDLTVMKGRQKIDVALNTYKQLAIIINEVVRNNNHLDKTFTPNLDITLKELLKALQLAEENKKATFLTDWRNNYFNQVSSNGVPQSKDIINNKKLLEIATVYESFTRIMNERSLFTYDDMILEVINTLKKHNDFKLTIQEKYNYILLDEYQDTNKSQAELINLLTNNPIFEGRPNVLAVGDDDQAIMAFQGAESSNMLDFYNRYNNTLVINLTKNYRSASAILETAKEIAEQIEDRLTNALPINIEKDIIASNENIKDKANIQRINFKSQIAEYSFIAQEIKKLLNEGVDANEIAVLSPKHKLLQALSPFLKEQDIPIFYEKRENILEDPTVSKIIKISNLLLAIKDKDDALMNKLFPEVLSFDFWNLKSENIWRMSWIAYEQKNYWLETMLEVEDEQLKEVANFLISLATKIDDMPLEKVIDLIMGTPNLNIKDNEFKSPLYSYLKKESREEELYDTIINLTQLRDILRDRQNKNTGFLRLNDFVNMINSYNNAGLLMNSTNPHKTAENSVQLISVHSAKGLEFKYTFLISVNKSSWNSSPTNQGRIQMPKNLQHIKADSSDENTRKRLFFVALTRAKTHLYLTNYIGNFKGNKTNSLEFLNEAEDKDTGELKAYNIPKKFRVVQNKEDIPVSIEEIKTNWHGFYLPKNEEKIRELLRSKLNNYKISPTHVNNYINITGDVESGKGPQGFYETTILRFPTSYSASAFLGSFVHEIMDRIQKNINNSLPINKELFLIDIEKEIKQKTNFSLEETKELIVRAKNIISHVLNERMDIFQIGNKSEQNFAWSGVTIGNAQLTGKIDLIKINEEQKTITVVDFKTGKIPFSKGKFDSNTIKVHAYEQQLYFYKILIENTPEFKGYSVTNGILEFIEKDLLMNHGYTYEITFDENKLEYMKLLIQAVYDRVQNFVFDSPEVTNGSLSDVRNFENELIKEFAIKNNLKEIYINNSTKIVKEIL